MVRKLVVVLLLGAVAAPAATADRPPPTPAGVAASRACNQILRRIGFERFQTRFKAPETCVAQLTARLAHCAGAADPDACLEARVEALVREYTGDEPLGGGAYTTQSGAQVRIVSSDESGADENARRAWAELLDRLVHGDELGTVTLRLSTPEGVRRACGPTALACYLPETQTIVAPTTAAPPWSAESLVAHEYGHHVARNRLNPPWRTIEHGPKRWATYMRICGRVRSGELVTRALWGPGYRLSPAEGFAEAYRVLNERLLHPFEAPWLLVDERFRPDAEALRLVEEDVRTPWSRPATVTLRGRGSRSFRVATPLDGGVEVRVAAERGSVYRVSAPRVVCGQRSILVRVRRVSGAGPFRLVVSRP